MMCKKNELRSKYRALRKAIDIDTRNAENEKIFEQLINCEEYKLAKTIFVYASFNDEVKTDKIIKRALKDGKCVSVPLCDKHTQTMNAVVINDILELAYGAYGIPEPPHSNEALNKDTIDLAIVPALAFDKHGTRLGYGGGYYDKFLKDFKGCTVGLAFSCCIAENLPCAEFDVPVSRVISTTEMI